LSRRFLACPVQRFFWAGPHRTVGETPKTWRMVSSLGLPGGTPPEPGRFFGRVVLSSAPPLVCQPWSTDGAGVARRSLVDVRVPAGRARCSSCASRPVRVRIRSVPWWLVRSLDPPDAATNRGRRNPGGVVCGFLFSRRGAESARPACREPQSRMELGRRFVVFKCIQRPRNRSRRPF